MAVVSHNALVNFVQELMNKCTNIVHSKLTLEVGMISLSNWFYEFRRQSF